MAQYYSNLSLDADIVDENDDRAIQTVHVLGWKSVLLLQFQPQFEIIIMFGIFFTYICVIMDLAFAYSCRPENIIMSYKAIGMGYIYCFDMVYLLDTLLMAFYKSTTWDEVKHLYDARYGIMVAFDILSVLPYDAVYYSLTAADMRIIYALRLRYLLRVVRFCFRISNLGTVITANALVLGILQFLIFYTIILTTSSCTVFYLVCQAKPDLCHYQEYDTFWEILLGMSREIVSGGQVFKTEKNVYYYLLFNTIILLFYCFMNGFFVGVLSLELIRKSQFEQTYLNIKRLSLSVLLRFNLQSQIVYQTTLEYFNLYWNTRKALKMNTSEIKLIPTSLMKQICLDVSWNTFKHSHLFRNRNINFLRMVAICMKQKFGMPGETLFERDSLKSMMIYVTSGVVQILSAEDGETPILSFSGGTCLGEANLIISYPSTCTVVCQSYCELHVLHKPDFYRLCRYYPKVLRSMQAEIKERYEEAKRYSLLMEYTHQLKKKKELLTIQWLKSTLKLLMTHGNHTMLESLEKQQNKEFDKNVFCATYLDLLVLSEESELATDSVFLRDTCPCILQPNSFVMSMWNTLVAVVILLFVFIYPYYASFQPHTSIWFLFFTYMTSVVWILDVYVAISTAVKNDDTLIDNISEIVKFRLRTIYFCIDMVTAFPYDVFGLFLFTEVSQQGVVLTHACKLLKLYKIRILFRSKSSIYMERFIYTTLFIYYSGAIYYLAVCYGSVCYEDSALVKFLQSISANKGIDLVIACIYKSTEHIVGIGLPEPDGSYNSLYTITILVSMLALIVYMLFLATTTARTTLKHYETLRLQGFLQNINTTLTTLKINPILYEQVHKYIRCQIDYNGGTSLLYSEADIILYNHPNLLTESRYEQYKQFLNAYPLYTYLSSDFLTNICGCFFTTIFPPGMVITHCGEVCKQVHFINKGYCKVFPYSDESLVKVEGHGFGFSFIEMCFGIPIVHSVIALTHVEIVSTNSSQFQQIEAAHPEIYLERMDIVQKIRYTQSLLLEAIAEKQIVNSDNEVAVDEIKCQSFKHFGYRINPESPKYADYHQYFDDLKSFGFLRYFVFRSTIHPSGRFIHIYEIYRCVCAFATVLLYPMYKHLTECENCYAWHVVFRALDVTAWIDILIRHHIAYYNKDGIEITHPIKTITHYWTHSFVIDLMGCVPYMAILQWYLGTADIDYRLAVCFKLLRCAQMYRIFCGIKYLGETKFSSPSYVWPIVKFLPVTLVLLNIVGAGIINNICIFGANIPGNDKFTSGVTCNRETWITESNYQKPLSTIRVHVYGLLFAANLLIRPSLVGFKVQNVYEAFLVVLMSVVGYWAFFYTASKVICKNLLRNADLSIYQAAMADLIKFLSYRHIDKSLKKEVIRYFEYAWRLRKGKNLKNLINKLNFALQGELFLDVYGNALKESEIFRNANSAFIRSLLLNVEDEIILKRGIICRVNDVQKKVYFVLKGSVEVLGPDFNRLKVLPKGSIFGNLDSCVMKRQTLTMVAKGHVELLSLPSVKFHELLSKYTSLKKRFRQLTALHDDFILGIGVSRNFEEESISLSMDMSITDDTSENDEAIMSHINTLKYINMYDNFALPLVGISGFALQLYQITMQDTSINMIMCLYALDILGAMNIYMKFQTGFENEYGILVLDKRKIALRYIKDPCGFFLHLVAIIPFEIICVCFINTAYLWIIWSYTRCNRLLLVVLLVQYFHSKSIVLNINVYLLRTSALIIWMLLCLHVLTCCFIQLCCLNPEFNVEPLVTCSWNTSDDKLIAYIQQFYTVSCIFTVISPANFYPNSATLTLYTFLLLIVGRLLNIVFISVMCATLDIVFQNRMAYVQEMHKTMEFVTRERVSGPLIAKCWTYITLLWKKRNGHQYPMLLEEAPNYLREGVLNSMFGYHLRRHYLLRFCHVDLIRQISAQFQTRIYLPGDYITFYKDIDECMYFIHEGQVNALIDDDAVLDGEQIEKTYFAGEMFGFEQGLYPRCGHEYTYKAKVYSLILVLERSTWFYMLQFFPASKDTLYSLRREKQILHQSELDSKT